MDEIIDITVSGVTLLCCIYIVLSMTCWVWKLRHQMQSPLVWVFVSIIFAKIAVGDWALTNLWIMLEHGHPPFTTLRPRVLMMLSVMVQILAIMVVWRRQHPQKKVRLWP